MGEESRRPPVVLLAEDDPATRLLLCRVLEHMKLSVVQAVNGEEALTRFRETLPTLVLTDIGMPKMDGLTACAEIRKLERGKSVPILIFTAKDEHEISSELAALGVAGYLKKPIKLSELKHQVTAALVACGNSLEVSELTPAAATLVR